MKKITALILCIVLCLALFCACGRKTDAAGNTLITSSWDCVSYTVNGKSTDIKNETFLVKLLMSKDNPKFKCDDGENFTITLLQNDHSGKVVPNEDGTYSLVPAKGKGMTAEITGNTLMVHNEDRTVELVFETS